MAQHLARRQACNTQAVQNFHAPKPLSNAARQAPQHSSGLGHASHSRTPLSQLLTPKERLTLAQSVVLDSRPSTDQLNLRQPELRIDLQTLQKVVSSPPQVPIRQLVKDDSEVWVFAYGGNMCCETLMRRGVNVRGRDPAFVTDPNIRLVFKHRGGQATLEALPQGSKSKFQPPPSSFGQACVHGVLYRMPATDLKYFQSRDYTMTDMEVETYDGGRVTAKVFVSAPLSRLPQEVTPPELYMSKLREGAADNYLDPYYQGWLSSIDTVTSAGLGSEYWNTPSRYISYSFLLVALTIVAGYVTQHFI